jgi:hypothetical protein
MGCFPCFGPGREEELEYYGGNGGAAGWAAASSSAAAAGGGGAEAAVEVPPRAERIPAGACRARAAPSPPPGLVAWFVGGIGIGSVLRGFWCSG